MLPKRRQRCCYGRRRSGYAGVTHRGPSARKLSSDRYCSRRRSKPLSTPTRTAQVLTAPAAPPRPSGGTGVDDTGDLAEFGYDQQLHRPLGQFASFAAGFSFVSILTTIFQLFGLGFGFGGPAVLLDLAGGVRRPVPGGAHASPNWPRRYPISGAIYQWSRRMGGEVVGWFAGWFMILAQIVTAVGRRDRAAGGAARMRGADSRSSASDPRADLRERRHQRGAARHRPAGAHHRSSTASASTGCRGSTTSA